MRAPTLYTAKWFRAAVRLEGDRIIPGPPFVPYDPFTKYFLPKDVTRWNRSLHYQFAAVNAADPQAVLKFCDQFGVLGKWVWPDVGLAISHHVRQQQEAIKQLRATLQPGTAAFNEAMMKLAQQEIEPDPASYGAPMPLDTFRQTQSAMKTFMAQAWAVQDGRLPNVQEIRGLLSSIFAPHTLGVNPILVWDVQADRWSFRWTARSLEAILWIMLMLDLLSPGRIVMCARCRTPFLGMRQRDRFCSDQCGANFKVTAYRIRQKKYKLSKATAKGGSRHGKKSR